MACSDIMACSPAISHLLFCPGPACQWSDALQANRFRQERTASLPAGSGMNINREISTQVTKTSACTSVFRKTNWPVVLAIANFYKKIFFTSTCNYQLLCWKPRHDEARLG